MGEVDVAILSCSLRVVFERLGSKILKDFQSRYGDDEDLKHLKRMLRKIETVLHDAGQRQMDGDEGVKEWLDGVKDLVYDAEDTLDMYVTEVLRRNQVSKSSHAPSNSTDANKMKYSSYVSVSANINKLKKDFDVESPLKEIIKKSKDLVEQMKDLSLKVGRPTTEIKGKERERETSSLVDESRVYGRECDKKKIIEMLLSDETSGGDEVGVLPIVGMGGLGKTTLAQLVYNDERVVNHFDLKAWVCVSEEIDIGKITKYMLESLKVDSNNLQRLDSVQVKLKETLNGKRFLIVLDDIWNEDSNHWNDLRIPFTSGKPGSRIIVTTRSKVVSEIMGTIDTCHLGVLKDEDCWSLFCQYAARLSVRPNLQVIGKEIVKKCQGLPLAAKMLGSLLRSKNDEEEWRDILTTGICDIGEGRDSIKAILRLSYRYLPSHLKQCFAYCSIFPKDYKFKKDELVWMWIAEGFVHSEGRKQILEGIGSSYFDDLCSRSFFQHSKDEPVFLMHDLIHDLAQSILGETSIVLDDDNICIPEKARHSSFVHGSCQKEQFDAFFCTKRLRTFLLKFSYFANEQRIQKCPYTLFPTGSCLRVLSLCHLPITELPESISNLKLLRYLDLNETRIEKLPESICALYNLQTLILGYSFPFVNGLPIVNRNELPKGLHKLVNLRHLEMKGEYNLSEMPCRIGELSGLQTLSKFYVGQRNESAKLRELKGLTQLRGRLSIFDLQNVADITDVKEANLKDKQHLSWLTLCWKHGLRPVLLGSRYSTGVKGEEKLEFLQPHKNLKVLCIDSYPGISLPIWITMLSNLVELRLYDCNKIEVLPPLGQLSLLKHLYLWHMPNIKHIGGCELYGDGKVKGLFPSLESLVFDNMPKLEELSFRVKEGQQEEEGEELFPCFVYLRIECCQKLTRILFCRLPSLDKLEIRMCEELTTLSGLRTPSHGGDGGEFPRLRNLFIDTCDKLTQFPPLPFPSLVSLSIIFCTQLDTLPSFSLFTCLEELEIKRCPGLTSFTAAEDEEGGLFPISLKKLCIRECGNLKELSKREWIHHNLTSDGESTIKRCGTITALKEISIEECENLESLPVRLQNLTSLEKLNIKSCPQLVTFPEGGLPTKLKEEFPCLRNLSINKCDKLTQFPPLLFPSLVSLSIFSCKQLDTLPRFPLFTCLEELKIEECPVLTSFTAVEDEEGGLFPISLKKLCIRECGNLKELSKREWIHHNLTADGDSTIKGCGTTTALKEISIEECENLESLPVRLQNLTSLEKLNIESCPRLVTFPEGGLPTKLKELTISGCGDNLDTLPKYVGLHRLTSLEKLTINGCSGLLSFPSEVEWVLPPNLRELYLHDFESLEFFSPNWLNNLTSLKELCIWNAPKVASLSEQRLPTMLQKLDIYNCPLLEELCEKEKGRDWDKIAHIPDIDIYS